MKPSKFNNKRGFSIVELTIYSALLLFLMAGLYALMTSGMRYLRLSRSYQNVSQEAMVAAKKVTAELANTSFDTVTFDGGAPTNHIIFLSSYQDMPNQDAPWSYDGGGRLQWHKWVCFYHDSANSRLMRTEQPEASSPVPIPPVPTPPSLAALQAISTPPTSVVARQITNLVFNTAVDRISISITAQEATGSSTGQVTEVTLTTQVRPENAGG